MLKYIGRYLWYNSYNAGTILIYSIGMLHYVNIFFQLIGNYHIYYEY